MQYWGVCDKIHSFGVKPYIVPWPYTQRFIIMQSWFCNCYVVLRTNTCNKLCKVFSNVKQFSENYCVGNVMLSEYLCPSYVIYTIKDLMILWPFGIATIYKPPEDFSRASGILKDTSSGCWWMEIDFVFCLFIPTWWYCWPTNCTSTKRMSNSSMKRKKGSCEQWPKRNLRQNVTYENRTSTKNWLRSIRAGRGHRKSLIFKLKLYEQLDRVG